VLPRTRDLRPRALADASPVPLAPVPQSHPL